MPVFEIQIRVSQMVSASSLEEAEKIAFDELSPFDTEHLSSVKILSREERDEAEQEVKAG